MTTATLKPAPRSDPRLSARKIVLAKVAGFCFGVRRAVELTLHERSRITGTMTTVGPVVHNAQVSERLRTEGIEQAGAVEDVSSGTIVISAHGASPQLKLTAQEQRA